jgi:hypothetical protein
VETGRTDEEVEQVHQALSAMVESGAALVFLADERSKEKSL